MTEKKYGLNGCVLKCIAMTSMLVDHIGAVLFPQYLVFRMIGRLAFPIYCFLLVEGAVHTKDIRKYEIRLLIFALISEVPFDLAFYGRIWLKSQNVFFTLFLGVVAIDLMKDNVHKLNNYLIIALLVIAAEILRTDYGGAGIVFIVCYYLLYQKKVLKQAVFLVENAALYGIGVQTYASFAVLPMLLYNGRKGPSLKYFFYIFYPAHLLILYLIICVKYGN